MFFSRRLVRSSKYKNIEAFREEAEQKIGIRDSDHACFFCNAGIKEKGDDTVFTTLGKLAF